MPVSAQQTAVQQARGSVFDQSRSYAARYYLPKPIQRG